jgi:hypothetical protein
VVDGLVMLLYLAAYSANLLATPLDDALTHHAAAGGPQWHQQAGGAPLGGGLGRRLALWHAANLARIGCCGAAWALVCFRSNPYVMVRVFEARAERQQQQQQTAQQQVHAQSVHHGSWVGRQLMQQTQGRGGGGSSASGGGAAGAHPHVLLQQQQAWVAERPTWRECGRCGGARDARAHVSRRHTCADGHDTPICLERGISTC